MESGVLNLILILALYMLFIRLKYGEVLHFSVVFVALQYSKQEGNIWPINVPCRILNIPCLNMLCSCTETLGNHVNWRIKFLLQLKIKVGHLKQKYEDWKHTSFKHLEEDCWKNFMLLCTCCCIASYFYRSCTEDFKWHIYHSSVTEGICVHIVKYDLHFHS